MSARLSAFTKAYGRGPQDDAELFYATPIVTLDSGVRDFLKHLKEREEQEVQQLYKRYRTEAIVYLESPLFLKMMKEGSRSQTGFLPVITERREVASLARRLGMREDWHEPDEQGVTVEVRGSKFDNAGVGDEFTVILWQEGKPIAEINLATLLAFASGWKGHEDLRRDPSSESNQGAF